MAEFVLGKRRILEIYLNVVEWGPGIYGADAACRYYYKMPARNIGRQESARLAAVLPGPLKRRPERMNQYSAIILNQDAPNGLVSVRGAPYLHGVLLKHLLNGLVDLFHQLLLSGR